MCRSAQCTASASSPRPPQRPGRASPSPHATARPGSPAERVRWSMTWLQPIRDHRQSEPEKAGSDRMVDTTFDDFHGPAAGVVSRLAALAPQPPRATVSTPLAPQPPATDAAWFRGSLRSHLNHRGAGPRLGSEMCPTSPTAGRCGRCSTYATSCSWRGTVPGYHDLRHLAEVLDRLDELDRAGERLRQGAGGAGGVVPRRRLRRAARTPRNARRVLAEREAPRSAGRRGRPPGADDRAPPGRSPTTSTPCALSDADLAILAAPVRIATRSYARDVRTEYAQVPDADFRAGRAAVLARPPRRPVAVPHRAGAARCGRQAARANVQAEIEQARAGSSGQVAELDVHREAVGPEGGPRDVRRPCRRQGTAREVQHRGAGLDLEQRRPPRRSAPSAEMASSAQVGRRPRSSRAS